MTAYVPVSRRSPEWRPLKTWNPPSLGDRQLTTAERYGRIYRLTPRRPIALGDVQPQQINALAATGASTTVGILMALGTVSGGVGAVIGGLIAVASQIANMFHGCGQTCVVATQDANKAESILQQNLQQFQSSPVKSCAIQQAAINNANTIFAALRQACSDPSLAAAGQRCISERLVRGGTAPWCPKPGNTGCDWLTLYLDPIVNTPCVPDSTVADSGGTSGGGGSTSSSSSTLPAWVPAAAIAGAILLVVML